MLTADGMAPPGVDAGTRLKIERQMLDQLVHGSRQVVLTSILIGPLLTAWLTLPHIGAPRALTLLLCLIALGAERIFLLRRIARARAVRDDTPRRWARALGLRSLLGSLIIVLWFYWAEQTHNRFLISQMVALLTILAAGAAALFTSWPPVMWAVVSTLLLGMVAPLAIPGNPERLVVAVFCVVLWLVLVSTSLRSARTLHSEALALLRNDDLVRELRDKHAQAEAANAAKSRFFAAANHDLRQPLQAMGLYLNLLQPAAGQPLPDPAGQDADILARMRQCMTGMDQMLQSLLEVSRLEGGQLVPAPRAFALQTLFERLAATHEAFALQKQLRLRVRATTAWVCTDPALLERALFNLLGNALRYTRRGGVLLAARGHGARVRVCVVDTGVGIPEAAHELIYEEFVQLNNPERDPALGHGLGLPTVRRIATLLGLGLTLRSHVGRGSAFTLELPATTAHETPAPPAEVDAAGQLRGRVLVVEDNALARDALVRQLSGWGLQVQAVSNGQAACTEMARHPFDAVLSDWRLPGPMDGMAVLHQAQAQLPQLKLGLLITGEDAQRLHQLSPEFPVLRKPLRPLRLRTLLARHLSATTQRH